MKTLAGWHESKLDLGKYLQPGDVVDQEMVDYFLNVLPPATMSRQLIQIGEAVDIVDGKDTFATLRKIDGRWTYQGDCFRGHCTAPR